MRLLYRLHPPQMLAVNQLLIPIRNTISTT